MKRTFSTLLVFFSLFVCAVSAGEKTRYEIPLYGNTYYDKVNDSNYRFSYGNAKQTALVLSEKNGLVATTYVYLMAGQSANLILTAEGKGKVAVSVGGKTLRTIKVNGNQQKEYKIGTYKSAKDGHLVLRYNLLNKDAEVKIHTLVMEGLAEAPIYLKPETNTYFGLRGPSCHLGYDAGVGDKEVDWATISVTVPEEYDKEGSYYMALGFSGGYFGIQNNHEGKRNALFSVWNTQVSDDPNAVAKEHQVLVMNHGEGVTAQNFGGEGSGKQSFINVGWQANHTYKFLLHAERVDNNTVDYSAWFYDSVNNKWIYLSTLRRPNTKVLLTGIHSFLENFTPLQGNKVRKAYYHDGWVRTTDGVWTPIHKARLTNDATGTNGRRLDFIGGVEGGKFYLMNGGYLDRPYEINRKLQLDVDGSAQPPTIDLSQFTH